MYTIVLFSYINPSNNFEHIHSWIKSITDNLEIKNYMQIYSYFLFNILVLGIFKKSRGHEYKYFFFSIEDLFPWSLIDM